tara:strand:- start:172 stop:633 length:462 start_codon:yes stop_codon:yes gene_type:complete
MITFSLKCGNNHQFEGWFRSSDDYEDQVKKGLISCPTCNNKKISKALMAPSVRSSKKLDKKIVNQNSTDNLIVSDKKVVAGDYDIRQALRSLRSYVEKNCENVGENFASEARLISNGEAKNRNIYGKVSSKEAENLKDEGIEVTSIPWIKDDA